MDGKRTERRFLRLVILGLLLAALLSGTGGAARAAGPATPPPVVKITYGYDATGRLVSAAYEGVGTIGYRYDASGSLLVREAGGGGYPVYLPLVLRRSS